MPKCPGQIERCQELVHLLAPAILAILKWLWDFLRAPTKVEIPVVDEILMKLKGRKTYLAAAGLAAFAVWQFSLGDVAGALQTGLAALSVAGLRNALPTPPEAPPAPEPSPAPAETLPFPLRAA